MYFKQIFEEKLAQYSYLIGCQANGTAVVIDPMRDIGRYLDIAKKENLDIIAAADTHIHADYLSGLREFAETGIRVYASAEGGPDWQYEWLKNSTYSYELLHDGDTFRIGNIELKAWHTPGHTPEHLSFFITDGATAKEPMGLATGDFVFVGDVGRPDLLESAAGQQQVMEPSARTLYKSIEAFKTVPEYLQVWPGHGAGSACGKALGAVPDSTVGYELRFNNSIHAAKSEDHFVSYILDGQPEPPYYFARMKKENKNGPSLLGNHPGPKHMSAEDFARSGSGEGAVILDSRSMEQFLKGHLKGSLSSPLNKQFNTIAGSYIEPEEEIFLVAEKDRIDEAAADLIRIGLDRIAGYITPEDLSHYNGNLETTGCIDFSQIDRIREKNNSVVLDVRKASEFENGHVEGALNIAHTRLLPRKNEIPRERHLIVHCQAGGRANAASAYLKKAGFDVSVVIDNFNNYHSPVQ